MAHCNLLSVLLQNDRSARKSLHAAHPFTFVDPEADELRMQQTSRERVNSEPIASLDDVEGNQFFRLRYRHEAIMNGLDAIELLS